MMPHQDCEIIHLTSLNRCNPYYPQCQLCKCCPRCKICHPIRINDVNNFIQYACWIIHIQDFIDIPLRKKVSSRFRRKNNYYNRRYRQKWRLVPKECLYIIKSYVY